jgi:hypothetical protein
MADKNPRKRGPGRPKGKNREYAGHVDLDKLKSWAKYLELLSNLMNSQVTRMEHERLDRVWVVGREITVGLEKSSSWVHKFKAQVDESLSKREILGEEDECPEDPNAVYQ